MIECNTPTTHYPSGCALLNHFDANKNGIIDDAEISAAEYHAAIGKLTSEEIKFVRTAWGASSISDLCPDCHAPSSSKSTWFVLGAALLVVYLYLIKK